MFRYEFLYPFLSLLAFSLYPSLSKIATQSNSSLIVLCLGSFFAYFILLGVESFLKQESAGVASLAEKREVVLIAFLKSALSPLLILIGLQYSTVAMMAVMRAVETPVNVVLSSHFLGEKMHRWYWLGSLVTYTGMIAFITDFFVLPIRFSWADGLFFLAALINASGDILYKKYVKNYSLPHFLEQRSFVAGIATMLIIAVVVLSGYQTTIHVSISASFILLMLAIAVVPLILSQYFWHSAVPKASLCNLILFESLYILVAPVVAYFLLGETFTLSQAVSGGIMLLGVLITHLHTEKNDLRMVTHRTV